VTATAGNGSILVSWNAPADDGGSPITSYTATALPGGATCTGNFEGIECLITGLTAGTEYAVSVVAYNMAGGGPASSTGLSSVATPYTTPGAPSSVLVSADASSATVTWSAPADDGGSPITGYLVEYHDGDGLWISGGNPANTSQDFAGLANGTTYYFRVTAENAAGYGVVSATASGTPFTSPSAPLNLAATAGHNQVTLTWSIPVSDGGSPITSYQVKRYVGLGEWEIITSVPASVVIDGSVSHVVTGLTAGALQSFHVGAKNAAGVTWTVSEAMATPYTTPGAPTLGSAYAMVDGQVALTWTAPPPQTSSIPGVAVSDYRIEYNAGSGWEVYDDGISTKDWVYVDGLTVGVTHTFRVSAYNIAGWGDPSMVSASLTPYITPGTPLNLGATAGSALVTLSWTAPASDGGSQITDYTVQYAVSGSGSWSTFSDGTSTATSATVTGLSNATTYDFRVAAVNAAGTGGYSNTASALFTIPPMQASGGNSTYTVTVNGATYRVHEFTSTGSQAFSISDLGGWGGVVEYVIVGGGGGGSSGGVGGGGGGVVTGSVTATAAGSTVTVGGGGGGQEGWWYYGNTMSNGGASSAFGVTANGGTVSGTSGNGYAAGSNWVSGYSNNVAGGGGGAGGAGSNASGSRNPGAGGAGVDISSFFGQAAGYRCVGGGGGGSGWWAIDWGGASILGSSATCGGGPGAGTGSTGGGYVMPSSSRGVANTGGGGGTAAGRQGQPYDDGARSANGGSGVVYLRYRIG
jgi:titin